MGGSKFLVGYKLENIGKPVGFFLGGYGWSGEILHCWIGTNWGLSEIFTLKKLKNRLHKLRCDICFSFLQLTYPPQHINPHGRKNLKHITHMREKLNVYYAQYKPIYL